MKENNSKLVEKAIYCSFLLNHSEFALSVSFVQEVINTPEDYSTMPLSPTYLKGLINLRGMVIPVIDLKKVLNLKDDPNIREQKIAIIYLHGNLIGLLFDKTGEVFSANEDEQSNFSQDSNSDSVIRGVFKKDNGKRIIQILDVESIFCLKNIPKRTDNEDIGKKLKNSRGRRRQAISFVVGNAKCALEINEIQEILMLQRVNESALAVGNCIGTFDLR
ncbi:MAG: chemotaxis protein CheW, partial [Candidatus Cloacimonetes bacterium]|nr:chemotaxis protein CheW [Candidatus Cloacimonadota bacterium]